MFLRPSPRLLWHPKGLRCQTCQAVPLGGRSIPIVKWLRLLFFLSFKHLYFVYQTPQSIWLLLTFDNWRTSILILCFWLFLSLHQKRKSCIAGLLYSRPVLFSLQNFSDTLSQSARAAIGNTTDWGLINYRHSFLSLEAGCSGLRSWQVQSLVRTHFLVHRQLSVTADGRSVRPLYKGTSPVHKGSSLMTYSPPKGCTFISILGIRI